MRQLVRRVSFGLTENMKHLVNLESEVFEKEPIILFLCLARKKKKLPFVIDDSWDGSKAVASIHLELFVSDDPVPFQIFLNLQIRCSCLVTHNAMNVIHTGYGCVFSFPTCSATIEWAGHWEIYSVCPSLM